MYDERLDCVIARIRLLSIEQLHRVESLLTLLECGDLSPLLECGDLSPLFGCGDLSPLFGRDSDLPTPFCNKPPLMRKKSGDKSAALQNKKSGDESAALQNKESGDESPHSEKSKDWPHAPMHRLSEHGTYIVTAGTYQKKHWFRGADRLDMLESALLRVMKDSGWRLEAWAVFSNHYHFLAHAQPGAISLSAAIKQLHGETAREVNQRDGAAGRVVWHNFWDTELTFEKSYLARLNYVHQNAVKHGLVAMACQYRWCSAAWFERMATRAQVSTIYRFKIDKLNLHDDYEPI